MSSRGSPSSATAGAVREPVYVGRVWQNGDCRAYDVRGAELVREAYGLAVWRLGAASETHPRS